MSLAPPIREAPATSPLFPAKELCPPDTRDEPLLKLQEIQGNILPGFTKDFQTLLFLKINDATKFKTWFAAFAPFVSTAEEVLTFNLLFKFMRKRRGTECHTVKATWINIAFSFQGLQKLAADNPALTLTFSDQAFKAGLSAHSKDLGDPVDEKAEGHPNNWLIGGREETNADVVLIVASDDRADLDEEVARIEDTLYDFRDGQGVFHPSGASVIFKQHGANLPGSLSGHEHFGFLDGVSQPGVRGRISDTDYLTPRQNPRNREQGKPGQELLWPGEFVFGYKGQIDHGEDITQPSEQEVSAGEGMDWTRNGSFLVFRRLRQDVGAFHQFLHERGEDLNLNPGLVGAKLVGRWPSGAPVVRTPDKDDPALGNEDCANNDFEFHGKGEAEPGAENKCPGVCAEDKFEKLTKADEDGISCPFTGHIRKAYPRNELTPEGVAPPAPQPQPQPGQAGYNPANPPAPLPDDTEDKQSDRSEVKTQTHRIMRRGIPYGPVSRSSLAAPFSDTVDRGLLFLCYQTSIERQFEFITKNWINNPDFSKPAADAAAKRGVTCDTDQGNVSPVGHDPVIGQNNSVPDRKRTFFLRFERDGDVHCVKLETTTDWVIPTGGGYFFAPSLSALRDVLAGG